jgi:hypothetical protein
MVILSITGIVLSLFGGFILDSVFKTFDTAGVFDVPPGWQNMPGIFSIMNLYYFVCALFPVAGIGMFLKTLIRRTGGDTYTIQ